MKLARVLVASLTILGFSTATFAGDLQESIAKAARQEQAPKPPRVEKAYLVPGSTLFAVGMGLAVYGFLHTSGGEFTSGSVSKESRTGLGGAGLALAGVGGAILFMGQKRAAHAPSVTLAPGRVNVSKRVSW